MYHPDHRIFVRISRYVAQYIRAVYMRPEDKLLPITLPWLAHRAGRIVYENLWPNPQMKPLSRNCYSCLAFCTSKEDVPESMYDALPQSDLGEYTAFAMPEPHWFGGRWITDDKWMQLRASDASVFIAILEEEFWSALDRYWEEYQITKRATDPKHVPHFYYCLLDFMEDYHIDLDWEEAILRASKRRKAKMGLSKGLSPTLS